MCDVFIQHMNKTSSFVYQFSVLSDLQRWRLLCCCHGWRVCSYGTVMVDVCVCVCWDGTCVQADGTSWSLILNGTNSSASSQPDVADSVNNVLRHSAASSLPTSSAAGSLPVTHATVTPAGSRVDHLTTTTSKVLVSCFCCYDFCL